MAGLPLIATNTTNGPLIINGNNISIPYNIINAGNDIQRPPMIIQNINNIANIVPLSFSYVFSFNLLVHILILKWRVLLI